MKTIPPVQFTIYPLSEKAITIEFGNIIDEGLVQHISGFNQLLRNKPFPGMYETVLAYTTLSVFYDPVKLINADELPGANCYDKASGYLLQMKNEHISSSITESKIINIPVCYGGNFGPDLDYVAEYHHITTDEVIRLHSAAIYKVYMIGFIPGFAYLGGLPDMLETPRKASPRKSVPAGAVGIAGKQTGVYPLQTPGGWQLIGQTPVKLFDPSQQTPALLKTADWIQFNPISLSDFESYTRK